MTSSGMASPQSVERGSTDPGGPAATTGMNGARACSAMRCSAESAGPTPTRRQPRRAASAATERVSAMVPEPDAAITTSAAPIQPGRSEEHTSELQSHLNLVCRLLLEKKKERALTAAVPRSTVLADRQART